MNIRYEYKVIMIYKLARKMILSGIIPSDAHLGVLIGLEKKLESILWIHWNGKETAVFHPAIESSKSTYLIIQGFVCTFKSPSSVYCFQNIPSRLELMVNVLTYLSSEE